MSGSVSAEQIWKRRREDRRKMRERECKRSGVGDAGGRIFVVEEEEEEMESAVGLILGLFVNEEALRFEERQRERSGEE